MTQRRLGVADLAIGLALLVLLGWSVTLVDMGGRPEEDAAMLLRYSKHVAEGWGIVWNIGEKPVDGATDFLFMLAVAGVHRLGVSLEGAARGIGLLSHALTVLLVYFGARALFGASRPWAFVPAVFLIFGPALRHVAACFGTPLFALAATVTWILALRLARAPGHRAGRDAVQFSLAALVLGLARPEGVFLGGFMLLAVLYARDGSEARTIVGRFLLVLLTLGLTYFLWRWHHFGYPLPNPFYKKGDGLVHLHSLRMSWRNLWVLSVPFIMLLPLGLGVRRARRMALFATIPVVLFVCLWVLISNETNYFRRFQYPILPVILVGCVPIAQALVTPGVRRRLYRVVAWAMALAVAGSLVYREHRAHRRVALGRMGLYDAALVLQEYAPRGFSLVTTEAGLLPFYSTWRAVDAWGLNDAYVAHHGGIDEAYLDRYRPEVIMAHAYFSPGVPDHGERVERRALGPRWYRMVMTLKRYAQSRDYELAACFGRNRWDTHYYWVRRGFPQSAEIVARIRGLDYYWDGEPAADFAPAGSSTGATGADGNPP